jgi:hypothetical protein
VIAIRGHDTARRALRERVHEWNYSEREPAAVPR